RCRSRHGACESAGPECDSPWRSEKPRRAPPPRGRFETLRRAPALSPARLRNWRRQAWSFCSTIFAPRIGLTDEFERAGIDLAARAARQFNRVRHRILDAVARELMAQQVVEF